MRSELVHEWRKFLFVDPGLPAELLPPGWPGIVAAAELFHAEADRLMPAAARFVDQTLATPNGRRQAGPPESEGRRGAKQGSATQLTTALRPCRVCGPLDNKDGAALHRHSSALHRC